MTIQYNLGGQTINSVELKSLLISKGVKVNKKVYQVYGREFRVSSNPLTCNSIILKDGTIVQLTDLSFHMDYIRSVMSWDMLKQLKFWPQLITPFTLDISEGNAACLSYKGQPVTEVDFPRYSSFYKKITQSGLPYLGNAVLQGNDWLSFQCLWPCDYACAGEPCQYCYSGGLFDYYTRKKKELPKFPSPQDAAEIVEFALQTEKCAHSIQITGGSTFNTRAECELILEFLKAIYGRVRRNEITGEIVVYMTPPTDPADVDKIFEAGVDRISCSLEIWSEKLAEAIMPGKMKYTGRKRHLECLNYIAEKYGPNKACSNLLIGVEPLESALAGAAYLAAMGVVPIASVWIPFGRPVMGSMSGQDLDYYRNFINGLAGIYAKYNIVPPGGTGLNVCICRDTFLQQNNILEAGRTCMTC